MKREIKFRAWDLAIKQMFVPSMINIHGDVRHNGIALRDTNWRRKGEEFETWLLNDGESFVLMQYIGKKDKHGKDIYEGDVLSFDDYDYEERKEIKSLYTVEFGKTPDDRYGYYLKGVSFNDYMVFNGEYLKCEVAGNVFENPELLNRK